jgi:hypothetical protein
MTAAVAVPASAALAQLAKRYPAWGVALLAALFSVVGAYYFLPVVAVTAFLVSLYVDPPTSFASLPFALLASGRVPLVTPLLGGYPSSVKAGLPAWEGPALSLPQCFSFGGSASMAGYATAYLLAAVLDKLSYLLPNQPMVKLSEPIFLGIGAGIMINVVRIRVRLASGIKSKLRGRRRGRAY